MKKPCQCKQLLFAAVLIFFAAPSAFANPTGGTVSAGTASINSSGTTLTVTQSTDKAVIDWQSFNINSNETTQFVQPSSSSITLNRINSGNITEIYGHLDSNGKLILVNPDGFLFGAGANVNVNSLVATTANISNQSFMGTGLMNFDQPGNPLASITNNGTITAADAGLVGLVAPNVLNNGVITARLGTVQLASADTFSLDFYGDGLLNFAVSPAVQQQLLQNTGLISAAGGNIDITAAAGASVVNSLIHVSGELDAPAVAQQGGNIYIYAAGSNAVANNVSTDKGQLSGYSTVEVDGTLNASGDGAGQTGGNISVLGDRVGLLAGASLDASGDAGGGTVQVGGDFHGAGVTPTSIYTYVDSNASIDANALTSGNGGNVAVWSDGLTYFGGHISAMGGALSGNGGNVETSGEQTLDFANGATVSTEAVNGQTGTLLLDPTSITILAGTGDSAADGTNTFEGSTTPGTIASADTLSTVYQSELEGIAATTNISLTTSATGSITLDSLGGGILNLAQTAGNSVTFSAGSGGFIMMNTADTIQTAGGALNIITLGGSSTIGNLTTGGGLITLNIGGTANIAGVISNTTGIVKSGTGTLTLSGVNTYTGGTTISGGTLSFSGSIAP